MGGPISSWEDVVEARVEQEHDGRWVVSVYVAGRHYCGGVLASNYSPSDGWECSATDSARLQQQADATKPLVLLRLRKRGRTPKGDYKTITEPTDGILIWIEDWTRAGAASSASPRPPAAAGGK